MPFDVFNRFAGLYDSWYDGPEGRIAFPSEVECLRGLMRDFPPPALEVGVGTGRFAEKLSVRHGVDPAPGMLIIARTRGVAVVAGRAESLPYRSETFGAALVVVTLCFANRPDALLRECRRVLRPDGGLVLGLVLRESPWGRFYERKAAEGHRFYSVARFYTRTEVEELLRETGFRIKRYRSTLFQPPESPDLRPEEPREGYAPDAGFVCLSARKG